MNTKLLLVLLAVLMATGVLLLDVLATDAIAWQVLYVGALLPAIRFAERKQVVVLAACLSLLIAAGLLWLCWRHTPAVAFDDVVNSLLSLAAVWTVAFLIVGRHAVHGNLAATQAELKELNEQRSAQLLEAQAELQSEIDERARAEQRLGRSEAHYLSLIESLPIHVIRKDTEGRFTFASPSFCELLGVPLEQVLGKTDFDFYPRHLAEKYRGDDQRVVRERRVLNQVEVNQRATGEKAYVQVIKMPIFASDGALLGMQGIFWDVTARMQAEDHLRESEARKRAILETAMDCILFLDEQGMIVEANHTAAETLQCRRQDLINQDFAGLIETSFNQQRFRESLAAYARDGRMDSLLGRRVELSLRRATGEAFAAEMSTQPIPLMDMRGYAIFLRDITARRQAEQALRDAKEAAEAASQAKSLFVANMSHEIRTPLHAIIGITDLLLDGPLVSDQRDYLTLVQDSAEALLAIIDDILDFSKIEAGKLELASEPFDLREWLGDTLKPLAVRAHAKGLELTSHAASSIPDYLVGDPHGLRQVIINLVGNAIKFTAHGEVVLAVKPLTSDAEQIVLQFSVQDTGIGIPEERRRANLEAFEQADNSMTRKFGGTGLGLAISLRLVEMMGGQLRVESHVGKGSVFFFTARFGLTPLEEAALTVEELAPLAGVRVLVVDDHAATRAALEEPLRSWKMPVYSVDGAREAIRFLRQCEPGNRCELVLVDANMPDVDGMTLTRWIQEDGNLPCRVILMLTSGDRPVDVDHCESLGVAACLHKPVKHSELLEAIRMALDLTHPLADDCGLGAPPRTMPPLRILLAEDSLVNEKLAVGLLQRQGHLVTIANNGREALTALTHQTYDLILMDVQMPEMDGLETTTLIRARERRTGGHVPIIAMTACAMQGDREECLSAGMDGYLTKPIRASRLLATVAEVLQHRAEDPAASVCGEGGNGMDWSKALEVVQGDRELLKDIIDAFLEECPRMLDDIRSAIPLADYVLLQRAAHTIKGSMRYLGADEAFERAYELECMGRESSLNGAEQQLQRLDQEIERLKPVLTAFSRTGQFVDPADDRTRG